MNEQHCQPAWFRLSEWDRDLRQLRDWKPPEDRMEECPSPAALALLNESVVVACSAPAGGRISVSASEALARSWNAAEERDAEWVWTCIAESGNIALAARVFSVAKDALDALNAALCAKRRAKR